MGLLSQNVLSQCRNLCETVILNLYTDIKDFDQYDYNHRKKTLKTTSILGKHRHLFEFHRLLTKSVSHYTESKDNSERLMLKYYENLVKLKNTVRDDLELVILEHIEVFNTGYDHQLQEYYEEVVSKINSSEYNEAEKIILLERYYLVKKKPFYVNNKIYYELTLVKAYDNTSKQDRITVFATDDVMSNYAIKLNIKKIEINILNVDVEVSVINDWEIAVRPCELKNFSKIFGFEQNITETSFEYKFIMGFMKKHNFNMLDIVYLSDNIFLSVCETIETNSKNPQFIFTLKEVRKIVFSSKDGSNVISYLMYKLNNVIIKSQLNKNMNRYLSNTYLKYGAIPFDKMPFATSLIYHNPTLFDLNSVFDSMEREHEILARKVKNNIETNDVLFTPLSEFEDFKEVELLTRKYNSLLYLPRHEGRKLIIFKGHISIKQYVEDTQYIVRKIENLSKRTIPGYYDAVDYWLANENNSVDCEEKKEVMRTLFQSSNVGIIYGSAGTGKTTLISNISEYFSSSSKLYLANTNPAKNNLENRVKSPNSQFMTVSKYLYNPEAVGKIDILFIDECTTIRNSDMKKILELDSFMLLVLVGDIYQIESINFGNWFSIINNFVHVQSVTELKTPYRTKETALLDSWNLVREISEDILEDFVHKDYSKKIDDSIFEYKEDQIILCLNYDGLYGINNINKILQSGNENEPILWGDNYYKVNDPILFNDSQRFHPLLYNNLKGVIKKIEELGNEIKLTVTVERNFTQFDTYNNQSGLTFVETSNGRTTVSFITKKEDEAENEFLSNNCLVPFQVAYAVSIHKAQGLEYENVKMIITKDVEDRISHNIFYTAITRAKSNLTIYWSPETEKNIVSGFKKKNNTKDESLLKIYT